MRGNRRILRRLLGPFAAVGRTVVRLARKPFVWGLAAAFLFIWAVRVGNTVTSADPFCGSCHVHPQATASWKQSTHYATQSGMVVHCVECHLPPGGVAYAAEKARTGIRDAWAMVFKDTDAIDWEERSTLEHARTHTYRESCLDCHPNLFPLQLSDEGEEAHLHYEREAEAWEAGGGETGGQGAGQRNTDELRCINCHLHVGHYDPDATDEIDFGIVETVVAEVYDAPAEVEGFVDYEERIPGTPVSFQMVAVPGGTFTMGSPATEEYREPDEGPAHPVTVSPFWMARVEVTWDEFEAWYRDTRAEGRTDTRALARSAGPNQPRGSAGGQSPAEVDAITGATPPYVPPDQGWGKGSRPAITMTHQAAVQYTRWLSEKTGREYRLPTEAEWEYAARGGTTTPYFFDGSPRDYDPDRLLHRVFGYDTNVLDSFAVHVGNSGARTRSPEETAANPFGLVNMLGNVREFTLDWYSVDTYRTRGGGPVLDPRGPETGSEHVIRGGSFKSNPVDLRAAARDFTRRDACFRTDPQIPKSIWWYSDCNDIGFRVVRVFEDPGSGGREP